jgi:hypothetical protein
MTDTRTPSTPAAHAAHDVSIVAALAARASDLDERTETAAREQVTACEACAEVLADLVALQATLPSTSTPARPRDFRLTEADAARLHRSGWRRVLGFFGSPRDGVSRPLAIGFTTLGLAGLLVVTVPTMSLGGGTSGAAPETLSDVGGPIEQAAPAPAASAAAPSDSAAVASAGEGYATERVSDGAAAAGGEPGDTGVFTGANPDELTPDITGDAGLLAIRDDSSGPSVLLVVAGILLIAGLGLFGLRWSARRLL